jgi:hypothetical protein
MKLIVTTRVKNELDIIEAFIRHHAQHFDKLILIDDGSSDGTYQILRQLQSVYPDLVVLDQPTIGYMQDRHMTLLLRMAVDKFGADWIAPLDVDEFIEPANGLMLTQVLAGQQPAVYSLGWSNFVWSADLEKSDQRNPVLRQRFCLPTRSDHTKLLLHAEFVSATAELTLGNHLLVDNGEPLRTQPLDCVRLCHYPIRSIAQYASKISIGHLQHLATPDRNSGNLFHYTKPFQELAELGLHRISKRMKQDSLCYSVRESEKARPNSLTIEAPLNYLGGPLTMSQGEGSFTSNLLRYAEMVATEFANVKKHEGSDCVSTQNASQSRLSELGLELLNAQNKAAQLELLNSQKKAAEQAAQETQRCLELEVELLNTLEQEAEKSRRLSELEVELLNLHKQTAEKTQRLTQLELELLNWQKKAAEQTANQGQRCLELEAELLNLHEQRLSELELDLLNSQKSAAERVAEQAQRFLELEVALLNAQEQLQSQTFRFLTRVHSALIRAKILRPRG